MEKRKSILLVTVDCLRADHVGFMGYSRPTSPFLDSLARESFVFPAAIVAGTPTFYSLPGILASRYPLALGRDVLGIAPEEPTLASVLHDNGYATAAFVAANPYISSRFGYGRGFQTFRDFLKDEPAALATGTSVAGSGWTTRMNLAVQKMRPSLGPLGAVYSELYFRYCQRVTPVPDSLDGLRPYPAAQVIVDHACNWLTSVGSDPFFLWLHFMDPHSPYYPAEDVLKLMGEEPVTPYRARYLNSYWNRSDAGLGALTRQRNRIIPLYDAGIRSVDVQLERLVQTLRQTNVWDDCVFVLTADHGEEFLDHGERYHAPTHLMEELIHVPLLLRVPGTAKTEVCNSPFSLLHLAPTVLDCAQVSAPGEFQGRSYWPDIQRGGKFDAVAISECISGCTNPMRQKDRIGARLLSVRESRFKLVLHFDRPSESLYDLAKDAGEQRPLPATAEKGVRRRLLQIAREHLRSSGREGNTCARLEARLRDLRLEWAIPTEKASAAAS